MRFVNEQGPVEKIVVAPSPVIRVALRSITSKVLSLRSTEQDLLEIPVSERSSSLRWDSAFKFRTTP